jgi:pSer/pThr/pTyr-binding forkhead associated (FHA) protein
MIYVLVPVEKGDRSSIPLHRPVLMIGRHPECDVRLSLPKISRRHCCLALSYDRVLIRDLGSRNGLRVNGRKVEEARIQAGDEIAIGPLIYRLVAESDQPVAASRPAPPAPTRPEKPSNGTAPPPVSNSQDDIGLIPLEDL